jgi:multidrug efflux pump subunit AcrA (membrane-fusion protein)
MKNPFRKSPMQTIETTIASLTKRGEQLAAKRVAAQNALDAAIKNRQEALLLGDLSDQRTLDKVQAAVIAATSDLTGIDDALAILAQQKAEAERQLAAERERIKRAAAADKLSKQIAAIEVALPGYLEKSRVLADALSEIGHFHFESGQMAGFLHNTMGQIEVAANFTFAELKAMPNAIRDGRLAIPGEPVRRPVEVAEPPPETQTASQGATGKSVPHIEPDPVVRAANFTVIDRSAEARTIQIDAPRS